MACAEDPSLAGVTVKNYQTIVLLSPIGQSVSKRVGLLLLTGTHAGRKNSFDCGTPIIALLLYYRFCRLVCARAPPS